MRARDLGDQQQQLRGLDRSSLIFTAMLAAGPMRAPGDACVLDQDRHANPAVRQPVCRLVMLLRLRNNDSHPLSVWIEQLAVLISPYIFPFLINPLGRVAQAGFKRRRCAKPSGSRVFPRAHRRR
jgi:hypothetical protein